MRKVTLSEICDISSGGTPSRSNPDFFKGEIPWAKISDIENAQNGIVDNTEEYISEEGLKKIRGKLFPKGTLLFTMYGSIGKVCITGRALSTNQAILGIRPKRDDEINLDYLKFWFECNKQKFINQGRGVALKNLSATIVRNLEMQLPPLDDQIRIAHLLSKIEGLITQRKRHLQQLDDLLKSVFMEMFGPQTPGYADWLLVEIKDLAAKHKGAMRTGPFGSHLLHSEFTTQGDVVVLGIDNAVQNRFAWGERRFITSEKYKELESYRIYPQDVIVTIMGTIGRSAVIPDDIPLAINTKHLAAITLNKEVANPLFVSYSIHSSPFILNQFKNKNRGAIMSGLNLGLIKETKLKLPPIEFQNRFASIHQKIDEIKNRYQQSLINMKALYGALSQKAFKSELDLSHILLPINKNSFIVKYSTPTQKFGVVISHIYQLPNTSLLNEAMQKDKLTKELLDFWLNAYFSMLGNKAFDIDEFIDSIRERIAELYPDFNFEFISDYYSYIQDLIFNALDKGYIQQSQNIVSHDETGNPAHGNRLILQSKTV